MKGLYGFFNKLMQRSSHALAGVTFVVLCLLVLRGNDQFGLSIEQVGVIAAMLFLVICVALILYFVSRSQSWNVGTWVRRKKVSILRSPPSKKNFSRSSRLSVRDWEFSQLSIRFFKGLRQVCGVLSLIFFGMIWFSSPQDVLPPPFWGGMSVLGVLIIIILELGSWYQEILEYQNDPDNIRR